MTRSRLLLVAACSWDSTVPLAAALRDAGFEVSVLAPTGHPLHRLPGLSGHWTYRPLLPLRSLRRAVEGTDPALVMPCDEPTMVVLRKLHRDPQLAPRLRSVIEQSLGAGEALPLLVSRTRLAEVGDLTGVATPRSAGIASVRQLLAWLKHNGRPAYMKIDRSNGGKGVVRVEAATDAVVAYLRLRFLFGLPRLIWLWLRTGNLSMLPLLADGPAAITIQAAVEGTPANCAFAAWEGKLLACVSVEALETSGPNGVATVIRVRDDPLMLDAARKVAARLDLSGLFGLDFILARETGEPWLIEINARPTQTAYLRLGAGADLVGALYAAITGTREVSVGVFRAQEIITLFDQPHTLRPRGSEARNPAHTEAQEALHLDLRPAADSAVLSR